MLECISLSMIFERFFFLYFATQEDKTAYISFEYFMLRNTKMVNNYTCCKKYFPIKMKLKHKISINFSQLQRKDEMKFQETLIVTAYI